LNHADTSAVLIPNNISANRLVSDRPAVASGNQLARDGQSAVTAEAVSWIADAAINKLNGGVQDEGGHFRLYVTATLIVGLTVLFTLSHYIGQKRRKEGQQEHILDTL